MQKIETIIKEQFAVEMKSKEHEIEVIDQVERLCSYKYLRPWCWGVRDCCSAYHYSVFAFCSA